MANQVTLDENGFVKLTYEGDQDESKLMASIGESTRLVAQLHTENKPVLILVDISRIGKLHSMARRIGEKALRTQSFDRIALFGWDTFTKYVINLIIIASGKSSHARFFSTADEAITWLKEYEK